MTFMPARYKSLLSHVVSPRRDFLRIATASALNAGMLHTATRGQQPSSRSAKLRLQVAGYPYDRVAAIQHGQVSVDGCQVDFEPDKIGKLNQHVFTGPRTRDVTEVGLIPYLLAFCNDDFRDYQLLPIFILKVFRHKSIFIHTDRGIETPADLRGRKVATVGYSSSGLTWIRGIPQNRQAMRTVCRYLHDQGLAKRELTLEELFVKSTLDLTDIENKS